MPNSHIAAMENANRRCGAVAARKLADALFGWQDSPAKTEFLYTAAATMKARGVIKDAELYPPEVLDAVGRKLRLMGLRDRDIQSARADVTKIDGEHVDLVVILRDGRVLDVNISVRERC